MLGTGYVGEKWKGLVIGWKIITIFAIQFTFWKNAY